MVNFSRDRFTDPSKQYYKRTKNGMRLLQSSSQPNLPGMFKSLYFLTQNRSRGAERGGQGISRIFKESAKKCFESLNPNHKNEKKTV
jgi:GTPase SAR1 family protein